jgi:hypothetical protein
MLLIMFQFLVMRKDAIRLNKFIVGAQIKLMKLINLLRKIKNKMFIIYLSKYFL